MPGQRNYKPRHASAPGRKFNANKDWLNLYDTAWEKYRLRFLKENPFCYACGALATVIDHIRPHKGDVKIFKDLKNHVPLCKRCHDTVTGKFDRRFVTGGNIIPKITWFSMQRSARENPRRVKVLPSYD